MNRNTLFRDLGQMAYKEAWELQEEVFRNLQQAVVDKTPENILNHLFFVEHPHVYTLGRNGDSANLLIQPDFLERIGATFYQTNRGGDITYHGPGQIVGYPVIHIESFCKGIREYIHGLEEAIILTVREYGVLAARLDGATGVWLDAGTAGARKICAIGVRAGRGVAMHGFAFNVNTQLGYFNYIHPCGFVDKGVTSLQKELGREMPVEEVKDILRKNLRDVLGFCFIE